MKEAALFSERCKAIEVSLCWNYDKTDCVRPSFKIDRPTKWPTVFHSVRPTNFQPQKVKEALLFTQPLTNTEAELCWKNDKTDCLCPCLKSIDQPNHPLFKAIRQRILKEAAVFPEWFTSTEAELCWKYDKTECFCPKIGLWKMK